MQRLLSISFPVIDASFWPDRPDILKGSHLDDQKEESTDHLTVQENTALELQSGLV